MRTLSFNVFNIYIFNFIFLDFSDVVAIVRKIRPKKALTIR